MGGASGEKRLAELLVIEWQKQRSEKTLTPPLRCYWQGADIIWQAFCAQMAIAFPEIALPAKPEPWHGEATLAEIARDLAEAKPDDTMLIAGCQVIAALPGTTRPAGESAALWLAGRNGPVQLGDRHYRSVSGRRWRLLLQRSRPLDAGYDGAC